MDGINFSNYEQKVVQSLQDYVSRNYKMVFTIQTTT